MPAALRNLGHMIKTIANAGAPIRVLVADDAPLIRNRIASQIRHLPGVTEVLESSDCRQTLEIIRRDRPAAVVLDLFMPGGTGLDVLHEIAGDSERPCVIVLTAWGDSDLHRRCLDAGADYFFEKGPGFLLAMDTVSMVVNKESLRNEKNMTASANPKQPAVLEQIPAAVVNGNDKVSVLVVEDHEFQRRVIAKVLRSIGVTEVHEASDGVEGLKFLKNTPDAVQFIVCDLDMPNMDGMEFMRHLGETGTSAGLIITSAHKSSILNSVQTMCQAYGIRPIGVLEKPATRERLQELIARSKISPVQTSAPGSDHRFTTEEILRGLANGEFEPMFQPKVELSTRRIVGAEALARWRHPEIGVLAPYYFIETLETAGQMDELTFMMLEASAKACRRWRESDLALSASVNLSLTSLADTKLAERISATVMDIGVDPRSITLEVTETAAMTEIAPALENLARLRLRGFGLSIDDFGTGFASMQQLGRVAFTELKIDRGFVSAMEEQREARAIVESSVGMAQRLGIIAVAEGIETPSQMEMLRALGCHQGQGYLVSKPVSEREFLKICSRSTQ